MQNISNYSNPRCQGQPVQHLQKHVQELTAYINENNQKYHKNMVTLKEFYEEQMQELQDQREDLLGQNSRLNNQVITVRDLLANSQMRVKHLDKVLKETQDRQEELRRRLEEEYKRNEGIYQEISLLRRKHGEEIQTFKGKICCLEEENNKILSELNKKESALQILNSNVHSLESKVSQSHLLPHKIDDLKKDQFQYQSKLKEWGKKCGDLENQVAKNQAIIKRLEVQNESLRMFKNDAKNEKKISVQKAIKEQKQLSEGRIQKLENENQGYVYQLNETQSRIKILSKQNKAYENQIEKLREEIQGLSHKMTSISHQKSDYVSQFSNLKIEYQGVIQRLQDTLITYQNKNWTLEQENKDLSHQLESLQQLLQEVKSINSLQVNRPQYRKMAQMELLAREKPQSVQTQNRMPPSNQIQGEGNSKEWEKLLLEIDKIAV